MMRINALFAITSFGLFWSCTDSYNPERNFKNIEAQLQEAFLMAKDSSEIVLPEGHFLFEKSLLMDGKRAVTIRGAGIDKTVLSFKGQKEGAEGIKISNCEGIILEGFTVEDALGDNIKVSDTKGITFRKVKAAWTGKIDKNNGAYGLYPVVCTNVLIEDCEAMGASDAGIYVGQSDSVIIRRNKAYQNVAGIESENSNYVDIYDNESYDNTGGLLIFDLPGLTQSGSHVRAYQNKIMDNNRKNFAPKGNIVAAVPPGTGVMILATSEVDVFENQIINNKTVGTAIISYELVKALTAENNNPETNAGSAQVINQEFEKDSSYNPFPNQVRIMNNTFEENHWFPDLSHDIGRLFLLKFWTNIPFIIFDGIAPEGSTNVDMGICISGNISQSFANLDAANDFKNLSKDESNFLCK
jgi:parallel beta-helix repeat protein